MSHDLVGADQQGLPPELEPLLEAIAAGAVDSDRLGVSRQRIEQLAGAGLLGTPLDPPALQRELAERLFMADGSLTFCWLQHQMPLRRLLTAVATPAAPGASALRERWLEPVRSGGALAAVAFAHLRRPGVPNPSATRVGDGWRLEGRLDWLTSWDIADLALLCLRCIDARGDRVVGVLLPAGASGVTPPAGLTPEEPLRLLAMGGTHTRPIRLEGAVVPEAQVLFVEEYQVWSEADARTSCRVSPVVFGCARGAIADLQRLACDHGDGHLGARAAALAEECRRLRRQAYALIDGDTHPTAAMEARHRQLRARALELCLRCAQAAVIAHAGAAMHSGCGAERRLREAAFLLVQAQTPASRRASLDLLVPPAGSP